MSLSTGRAIVYGGVATAIVGLLSHFLVAFCIVTVYVLASRVMPVLRKQWVICGMAFGVGLPAGYFAARIRS